MNRKLLNGLLLLSVATGGVATFTSCKDTEDGLRNEVYVGQKTLGDQIQKIRDFEDQGFVDHLQDWLDKAIDSYANGELDEAGLKGLVLQVCKLKGAVQDLQDWKQQQLAVNADLQGQIDEIVDVMLADITAEIAAMNGEINGLKIWQGEMIVWQTQVNDDIIELKAKTQENYDALQELKKQVEANEEALGMLKSEVEQLQQQYEAFKDRLNEIDEAVAQLMEDFNNSMAKLYSFLANKFAQFITSIPVHQTWNPIFGTINLPLGVQSNMVAGYFFNSDHDITFPATASNQYEYWTANPAVNDQRTISNINSMLPTTDRFVVGNGGDLAVNQPAMAPGNNMGNIFLSINPRNIDYNGLEVQLVNSKDEVILSQSTLTVEPYNGELNFGFTKANEGSAVYRLPVRMEPNWDDINQIAFDIENKGELANALKSAVQNHTISDFATLGHLIYEHLDGFLPAYAVRVGWRDQEISTDGSYTNSNYNYVYSNFNIAATVYRPLSFRTGFGYGVNKQLPTFDPISEYADKIIEKIRNFTNFDLDGYGNFGTISIDYSKVDADFSGANIVIDLSGVDIVDANGTVIGHIASGTTLTLKGDGTGSLSNVDGTDKDLADTGLGELLDAIAKAINDSNTNNEMAINDAVDGINDLIDQINDQIAELKGKITDKLDDITNKINDALSGKLKYADRLVDLYNQLAKRVNVFLKDPNHYLQVMMAYNAGDGLHHLSTNMNVPTVFVPAGGDAIQLFATSYNAELIVPAFKKYVAITNVYYPWGVPVPGFQGNLKKLNEKAGLNKVIEGAQQRIAISVGDNEFFTADQGYVYEVYYTALDYRGFTSTQKYYFTIKSK